MKLGPAKQINIIPLLSKKDAMRPSTISHQRKSTNCSQSLCNQDIQCPSQKLRSIPLQPEDSGVQVLHKKNLANAPVKSQNLPSFVRTCRRPSTTSSIKSLPNPERHEGVQARVLDLHARQPRVVPAGLGDPLRLLDLPPQHLLRQRLQPRPPQLLPAELPRGQGPQIHRVAHIEAVVAEQLLDVLVDADPDEDVAGIAEEVGEGRRDLGGVEELEDEAVEAHGELEDGDGVVAVSGEVGPPLDVQADQEGLGAAGREPGGGHGRGAGEEGADAEVIERDVIEVVGVVRELVVDDADRHRGGCCRDFRDGVKKKTKTKTKKKEEGRRRSSEGWGR